LDNRIPPRGFNNANFDYFGGAPVGYHYMDGQYWDDTFYTKPPGTKKAEVRLYYQSISKEFVEFLRDENRTDQKGQLMYDLWNDNGKCPPTLMAELVWVPVFGLKQVQIDSLGRLRIQIAARPGTTYTIECTDGLSNNPTWREFQSNGTQTANTTELEFIDDFTSNTSGGAAISGSRFYRFKHNGVP
ncbi:MAG: hypothetical protein ACK4UN_13245, partial [Limisphaerales bacterium]